MSAMKDWIPLIASLASAVVGAVLAFSVQLFWKEKTTRDELIEAKLKALEEKKNREIDRIYFEKEGIIKDKELKIKGILTDKEDQLRDSNAIKDFEIRSLILEKKELESENKRLQKASPEWLKDDYEDLRTALIGVNQELKRKLETAQKQIITKDKLIKEISDSLEPDSNLLNQLGLERDHLNERINIFNGYIEAINNLREQMRSYQIAVQWLDLNRVELICSAVNYIKSEREDLISNIESSELKAFSRDFTTDLDDYFDWIKYSLKQGYPLDLRKVEIYPKLPVRAYTEAFSFIKKEYISQELPDVVSDELGAFISSLIDYLNASVSYEELN